MASSCMSTAAAAGCIDPAATATGFRRPVRATYANLYKWPESDAEFVRSVASGGGSSSDGASSCHRYGPYRPPPHVRQYYGRPGQYHHGGLQPPRVVDSLSCRQMFLRSYTFTRKETVPEKAGKWARKARDGVVGAVRCGRVDGEGGGGGWDGKKRRRGRRKKKKKTGSSGGGGGVRRLKEVSCSALCALFRRLLSYTSSVDVVDDHHRRGW